MRAPALAVVAVLVPVLAVGWVGCAPSGPVVVEALVADPSADDGVRLDDVELTTLLDINTGRGSLFDARGGLQMAGLTVSDSAKADDSFTVMRDKTRGDGGSSMAPNMSFDGTRYVAEDLDTLTYFTAWHALEQAWLFARDDLKDTSPAVKEHSLLGINSSVVAADLLPLPILTADNAAYAAPLDAWLTLRAVTQDGVPFAMALPVIAHEFHHRVFHRNVFASDAAFEVWKSRVLDQTQPQRTATRILQGVDEGLANLYSLAATGDPDGLKRTFTLAGGRFVAEGERRALDGEFADAATYDGLRTNTLDAKFLRACNSAGSDDLFAEDGFNFYCLGTVLARALWDGSDNDIATLRADVLPAVDRALPRVGDTLAAGTLFDVDVLLAPLVDELPPGARRDAVCARLEERFTSVLDAGKVPGCL